MKVSVIIAAAGMGRRFGSQEPKQFLHLMGKPVLAWSIERVCQSPMVGEVIVAIPPVKEAVATEIINSINLKTPLKIVIGGATRQESVKNGLQQVDEKFKWIAVHDAARPLIRMADFEAVCLMAREVGAAILAIPIQDTIKEVMDDGLVVKTLDRSRLYLAQTPQVAKKEDLIAAYEKAAANNFKATDESSMLEAAGYPVAVVKGSTTNIKITTKEDLLLAEVLMKLEQQKQESPSD